MLLICCFFVQFEVDTWLGIPVPASEWECLQCSLCIYVDEWVGEGKLTTFMGTWMMFLVSCSCIMYYIFMLEMPTPTSSLTLQIESLDWRLAFFALFLSITGGVSLALLIRQAAQYRIHLSLFHSLCDIIKVSHTSSGLPNDDHIRKVTQCFLIKLL